jgi:hypothetical protein
VGALGHMRRNTRQHVPVYVKLACFGLAMLSPSFFAAPRADDALQSAQSALTERFLALEQDRRQHTESLKTVEARLFKLTQQLAPLVRVCVQTGAAFNPQDVDGAEKSAATVDAQLREASAAAKACASPAALKAARETLSNAIDQTAVIERLAYTGTQGFDELPGTRARIPESIAAVNELVVTWTEIDRGFKGFDARLKAYQHDAKDFNAKLGASPGLNPAVALEMDMPLRIQFDGLGASVRKIADVREQLGACERNDRPAVPRSVIDRIDTARKNAARAFAAYGPGITQDSATCQTRLEAKASPADATVLAEAKGLPAAPSEPPPPKAAPVGVVSKESLPRVPGSKEKPAVAPKRTAKRSATAVAGAGDGGLKVFAVSGFASTEEGSNMFGLGEGQTVAVGAFIDTKQSSRVRLGEGAQTIDIGADSRVQNPAPPSKLLKLVNGVVDIKRDASAAGGIDFEGIETTQGVITTASGRYRVTVGGGQTSVEVFEGKVHVAGTYVLRLAADQKEPSQQEAALTRVATQAMDLGPGERAIMLRVGSPVDAAVASALPAVKPDAPMPNAEPAQVASAADSGKPLSTPVALGARKVAKDKAAKIVAQAPQAPPKNQSKAPASKTQSKSSKNQTKAAQLAARQSNLPSGKPEIARAVPSSPRLPGFLSATPARVPQGGSQIANGVEAVVAVAPSPSGVAPQRSDIAPDPVEEARAQLQTQRHRDEELRRVADQRRSEQQRIEQQRAEEQRRIELREQQRLAQQQWQQHGGPDVRQRSNDQLAAVEPSRVPENAPDRDSGLLENASNMYGRAGQHLDPLVSSGDFAGTWQCRIMPSQRARYGVIQSRIVIRATQRGFEAIADGQRIPSVSVRGNRIHFAQTTASNDNRFYGGGIALDLLNGGSALNGSGRIRVTDGRHIQEVPASLTCDRSR